MVTGCSVLCPQRERLAQPWHFAAKRSYLVSGLHRQKWEFSIRKGTSCHSRWKALDAGSVPGGRDPG